MVGTIPNFLTLTRILLLPFFVATIIYESYQYALLIFVIASVTDLLDGLVARITRQISDFGKILDPVADKFFLITSYILMGNYGLMPKWLTIVVISKDLIIVAGSFILYFMTHKLRVEPTFLGKLASACQFILIGLVLLFRNISGGMTLHISLFAVVAVATAAACLHYIYVGLKVANDGSEL